MVRSSLVVCRPMVRTKESGAKKWSRDELEKLSLPNRAVAMLQSAAAIIASVPSSDWGNTPIEEALGEVMEVMPQHGMLGGSFNGVETDAMMEEMEETVRNMHVLTQMLAKAEGALAGASADGQVLQEVREVKKHFALREAWKELPRLLQASLAASKEEEEKKSAFRKRNRGDDAACELARSELDAAMASSKGALSKYEAAKVLLEADGLEVAACERRECFPRAPPAPLVGGVDAAASPHAKATASAEDAAIDAAQAEARTQAAAAAPAAAQAAPDAATVIATEKKKLEETLKAALGKVAAFGNDIAAYEYKSDAHAKEVEELLDELSVPTKALMGQPHSVSAEVLDELAGSETAAQLEAIGMAWEALKAWADRGIA